MLIIACRPVAVNPARTAWCCCWLLGAIWFAQVRFADACTSLCKSDVELVSRLRLSMVLLVLSSCSCS
jgi:hypothetical protein